MTTELVNGFSLSQHILNNLNIKAQQLLVFKLQHNNHRILELIKLCLWHLELKYFEQDLIECK